MYNKDKINCAKRTRIVSVIALRPADTTSSLDWTDGATSHKAQEHSLHK